ncbi:MAG: hypothetical protein V4669_13725 [Pseudomonadota bacterium]
MRAELKAIADGLISSVKEHVSRAVLPLQGRLDGIEKRLNETPAPKDGAPGKDASPELVRAEIAGLARQFAQAMDEAQS